MLNMAVAPLAFSKAARLGRGAMMLGAMPCPARRRGRQCQKKKKHRSKRKTKKEGIFVREHHINSKKTSVCVKKKNNSLIISSLASKQQSDTGTTQAEHGALLELLANKHSGRPSDQVGSWCFNSLALGLTRCNMSKHYLLRQLTRSGTGRKYTEREAALLAP